MASKQGKAPQTQILDPKVEWCEDTENHVLRVRLPGFKKDDFRVQIDNFGNLTIKGQRQLGDNKLELLHKVLQVPSNSNLDKVSGRYEGDCLSVTFPKIPAQEKEQGMEVPPQKRKDEKEEKREEKPPQKEEREEPKSRDEKFEKDYGSPEKKPKHVDEEKEKKEEKVEERKEEYSRPREAMPRIGGVGEEAAAKQREKATEWKKKVKEVIQGLSDYEFLDDLKETICKKKEVIAVAIAAFTIGFYASRKLK